MNRYRCFVMLLLILLLTGCSSYRDNGSEEKKVDMSSDESESFPLPETDYDDSRVQRISVAFSSQRDFPEELICSDGTKLEFIVYNRGVLGSDQEIFQGCQAGTISMFLGNITVCADTVPEVALLDIPYLVEELNEYDQMMQERIIDWLQPYYHREGLQLISASVNYMGCLTSQVPVRTEEDLKKLKLRTMENIYRKAYWEYLGVDVEMMAYDVACHSLKQGKINAMEAGILALANDGTIHDFDYIIEVKQVPVVGTLVMNREIYNNLSPECQMELRTWARDYMHQDDPTRIYANQYDLEILEPEGKLKEMLYSGKQVVIDQLKADLGEDIVDDFLDEVEQFQAGLN
ncbi:MAG: TRAP transporter substrate-binding protein DctP [Clostridiales bacterium]|nr:TRAP transporter substrate-binding protein DctP [Clostridiales bacterium]